jgi:hypothetical protein
MADTRNYEDKDARFFLLITQTLGDWNSKNLSGNTKIRRRQL